MTHNNDTGVVQQTCYHEERITRHEAQIERLLAKSDYKQDQINQMMHNIERFESKFDAFVTNYNNQNNNLVGRVTALENTQRVLKWLITVLFGTGIVWVVLSLKF